ncbi:MAG: hypothetical protein A2729_00535 [Candidatus Buchananbacteria bacterium RIFCSPHIGHO2_01_FULL_39_14]|uniref:Uncharacterized protein n=1 Tax=Candidatus Buchananbacteria bacterium RIFCSPHIGHO2_01_FULL_39_14 TaxID=1797532 RepID=A0A1G1XZ00_9BACT|nr:MAG: hypothetical protein A2729_00535 [Candidatus Buchananbacteria bacterium RIFCSPHIGHO2_01_FULL_39_14]OGY48718.1 MAG: hypothetical protein A3D39_04570 [Candidatus Buchananbacteria bacterium RIFCSPHIGHO2_02_FULL_39_17]
MTIKFIQLQTIYISLVILLSWIFGFTKDDYNFGHFYFLLWYYSFLMLVVFAPLIFLYYASKSDKIVVGKIFRGFVWFSILVFLVIAGLDFYLTTLESFNLTVLREFGVINFLTMLAPYLVYLTLIILMFAVIRVNRKYEK